MSAQYFSDKLCKNFAHKELVRYIDNTYIMNELNGI